MYNISKIAKHFYYGRGGGSEAPLLQSATVTQTTTNVVDLVFDIAVNITTAGWTIASDGDAISITSVIAGDGTTEPSFSLSRAVIPQETITLSYSGGATESTDGGALATITDFAVVDDVHIWMETNFPGSTVDPAIGSITNPDSANLLVSQLDGLRFTRVTDAAVGLGNFWESVVSVARGVFGIDFFRATGYVNSIFIARIYADANNHIQVFNSGGFVACNITVAGTVVYTHTTAVAFTLGASRYLKITYDTNDDIHFYYWDAGWTEIDAATVKNHNVGSSFKLRFESTSNAADGTNNLVSFGSPRISDEDYTTQYPEQFFV